MDLLWMMTGFFLLVTILFVVVAIAFPEWFGITGRKALEIQKHQQEGADEPAKDSEDQTP